MASCPDPQERPTLSVHEYAALMEVGLSTAYASVAADEIPVIRIGRRIRIPTAAVRRMLELDTTHQAGDAA